MNRPGYPRPAALAAESLRSALARPVATATAALVVAVVCVVVLMTTGRSAAAEAAVLGRLDAMGTRLLTVSDPGGSASMDASSMTALATVTDVQWALGLGPVADAHNVALPEDVAGLPVRAVYGDLAAAVTLTGGRWPGPGEALVSERARQALGLVDGVGAVAFGPRDPRTVPVVGVYRADPALGAVERAVLVVPAQGGAIGGRTAGGQEADAAGEAGGAAVAQSAAAADGGAVADGTKVGDRAGGNPLMYAYVTARSSEAVDGLQAHLQAVFTARNPSLIAVEAPAGLVALRQAVAGDMASSGRYLMLTTLGVGLTLVSVTMFAAVTERRRDYGRRRALGASRSAVVALVLGQAALAGVCGSALGTASGLLAVRASADVVPPGRFVAGLAALALGSALLAAVPPALAAALREPVRILRVA